MSGADRVGNTIFCLLARAGIGPAHANYPRPLDSPATHYPGDPRRAGQPAVVVAPYGAVSSVLNARALRQVTLRRGRDRQACTVREFSQHGPGRSCSATSALPRPRGLTSRRAKTHRQQTSPPSAPPSGVRAHPTGADRAEPGHLLQRLDQHVQRRRRHGTSSTPARLSQAPARLSRRLYVGSWPSRTDDSDQVAAGLLVESRSTWTSGTSARCRLGPRRGTKARPLLTGRVARLRAGARYRLTWTAVSGHRCAARGPLPERNWPRRGLARIFDVHL